MDEATPNFPLFFPRNGRCVGRPGRGHRASADRGAGPGPPTSVAGQAGPAEAARPGPTGTASAWRCRQRAVLRSGAGNAVQTAAPGCPAGPGTRGAAAGHRGSRRPRTSAAAPDAGGLPVPSGPWGRGDRGSACAGSGFPLLASGGAGRSSALTTRSWISIHLIEECKPLVFSGKKKSIPTMRIVSPCG